MLEALYESKLRDTYMYTKFNIYIYITFIRPRYTKFESLLKH